MFVCVWVCVCARDVCIVSINTLRAHGVVSRKVRRTSEIWQRGENF